MEFNVLSEGPFQQVKLPHRLRESDFKRKQAWEWLETYFGSHPAYDKLFDAMVMALVYAAGLDEDEANWEARAFHNSEECTDPAILCEKLTAKQQHHVWHRLIGQCR